MPTSQQANKPTSQQANKPTSQQANKKFFNRGVLLNNFARSFLFDLSKKEIYFSVIAFLFATFSVFYFVNSTLKSASSVDNRHLINQANLLKDAIDQRLITLEDILHSAQGLFIASGNIDNKQFGRYQQLLATHFKNDLAIADGIYFAQKLDISKKTNTQNQVDHAPIKLLPPLTDSQTFHLLIRPEEV